MISGTFVSLRFGFLSSIKVSRPDLKRSVDTYTRVELIITSSTLSEEEIYGDLVMPTVAQETPPKRNPTNIQVESEDGNLWLFKQSECLTYLVSTTDL